MAKVTAVFANGQPLDQEGLNQLKTATNLHEDKIATINKAIGNSTTTEQLASVLENLIKNMSDVTMSKNAFPILTLHRNASSGAAIKFENALGSYGILFYDPSQDCFYLRNNNGDQAVINFGANTEAELASVVADNISGTALQTLKNKLNAI